MCSAVLWQDGEGTISWAEFKKWFFDDEETEIDNSDKLITDEATRGYGAYKGTHAADELDARQAAQDEANNEQAALKGPVTASNTYEAPKEEEEVKEEVWTLPDDA